jgi:hypothetical protein
MMARQIAARGRLCVLARAYSPALRRAVQPLMASTLTPKPRRFPPPFPLLLRPVPAVST